MTLTDDQMKALLDSKSVLGGVYNRFLKLDDGRVIVMEELVEREANEIVNRMV